ncbi:MAG: Aminodeoxychorismate synthase component 1 [Candidatus Erwinia impunctatus]|nr:Aminodeoxychorismate synthase component 1 [Culicoides impunctatus]
MSGLRSVIHFSLNTMLPVYHSLDYTPEALETWFASVAHTPWSMLLHSGFSAHQDNRFDIMVADPCETLVTRGTVTEVVGQTGRASYQDDPLKLLQQVLQRTALSCQAHPSLPFIGGAVGLLGYDLARHFETLPTQAVADLHTPDMAVGIYDWALIADHTLGTLTLVVQGSLSDRLTWLQAQRLAYAARTTRQFHLTSRWQANMSRETYGKTFRYIQNALQAGDCYQVNLAQRFSASYQGDEWQAFQKLNKQNAAPFSAFLRLPESAVISLSPERFLKLSADQIETRPIKGTRPRLPDTVEDQQQIESLASSVKDRAENVMIVDLLRNDIGRVAVPGSVRVPELFRVEAFPAVYHLVSTITAQLRAGLHACDLLRACFPGGSITGAPKVMAMSIIDQLEPQRRNAWCGSIVYISSCGQMDSSITIRTLVAENGKLYCSAGGGIVADSDEQCEYQETFDKVNRILPCLENTHEDE